MKEVFSHSNYTKRDAAKTSFEAAWTKSTAKDQNKGSAQTQRTLLQRSALSGSGYAYPGLVSAIYTKDDEEEK